MEELILHEGGHVAMQELHFDAEYLSIRRDDPTYISEYAQENAQREDLSESIVPYFGFLFKRDQLSEDMIYRFERIMKNRIAYFDAQNYDFYPHGQ